MENDNDMRDYVDDFWDTFDDEQKAQLKLEGFDKSIHETIVVDFKSKLVVERYVL